MTKQEEGTEMELGKYREFKSMEELIADLHSPDTIYCPLCGCIYYSESASEIHCGVGCNGS